MAYIPSSEYADGLYEYGARRGYFASSVVANYIIPPVIRDSQIQYVLGDMRQQGQFSTDPQAAYFVFTPPGTLVVRVDGLFAAYHSGFYYGNFLYATIYANYGYPYDPITYSYGPMNYAVITADYSRVFLPMARSGFDYATAYISHEFSEICTDPRYWSGQFSWVLAGYDANHEIADLVQSPTDFLGDYLFAAYWSNHAKRPIVRAAPIPTVTTCTPAAAKIRLGASVAVTVRIVPKFTSPHAPTGELYLLDGGALIMSTVTNVQRTSFKIQLSGLTLGTHKISALYTGDDYFVSSRSGSHLVSVVP